jgi:hypothetical protein
VFNKWAERKPRENPSAPPTPFAMPEYELKDRRAAADLERKAQDKFAAGEDADEKGDKFVLTTVVLANALFFGGINQLSQNKGMRKVLLGIAIAFCVFGIGRIALLPPAP